MITVDASKVYYQHDPNTPPPLLFDGGKTRGLIRPGEKKGKYILVIHEGTNPSEKLKFNFSIMGWFPFYKEMPERLSDFGHPNRPPAYKVEVKELYDINEIKKI